MVGTGLLASMSIGWLASYGIDRFADVSTTNAIFYRSLIGALSFQGVGLVLAHAVLRQHSMRWREFLGLHRPDLVPVLCRAILVAFLAVPMALILNTLANEILTALRDKPPDLQPAIQTLQVSQTLGRRIFTAISAIVLAPMAEEVLFRGILYATVKEMGHPRMALFGTSIVFAAIHGSWVTLLPLTFFALVLTLLYERTRSLLAPIVAHASFNAVNLVGFYWVRDVVQRGGS